MPDAVSRGGEGVAVHLADPGLASGRLAKGVACGAPCLNFFVVVFGWEVGFGVVRFMDWVDLGRGVRI